LNLIVDYLRLIITAACHIAKHAGMPDCIIALMHIQVVSDSHAKYGKDEQKGHHINIEKVFPDYPALLILYWVI
jgi:hypothetical protein